MKRITYMMVLVLVTTACKEVRKNPLLGDFRTPHQTAPFDEIESSDYEPAFEMAIADAKKEVVSIAEAQSRPDFVNTIAALDGAGERLERISSIFFNLNSACTNDTMQQIAQCVSPKLTEYSNSVYMNPVLFERVKTVYDQRDSLSLTPEEMTLLNDTWKAFIKGGANLSGTARDSFKDISRELSTLSLKFEENTLAETNGFNLHITDSLELSGLPESTRDAAQMTAREKGMEGWLFTLNAPSYVPFLKYADDRDLREKMYKAYTSRCNKGNAYDNKEVIRKMVNLRLAKARLLGYGSYADYVLADRMAQSVDEVNLFLSELLDSSHSFALKERQEVADFAKQNGFDGELQRWDWAYYSNKLKQERYALDDEMLKPYFKLEYVQKGVFGLANVLYGLTFKEVSNIPKYHEDVRTFEVYDADNSFLAVLYTDFFPRESKNGGAWMTEYRTQHVENGQEVRPHVSIVMNFTKPTDTKPSLLTFDEVTTFLHEFGHALHGMLSKNHFNATAGTNVYRDFVELPSQLMENWALEKEWLDLWAVHFETNEKIPQEFISRIKSAANFQSGYANDRQISFGLVDMAWHGIQEDLNDSVVSFENRAMAKTEIFPTVEGSAFSTAFGHIFGGGYAAGYYSYKWAEVLDADAFSVFKQNGIFNKTTAESFRKNILEKGGSEHPMVLYVRFRGQEPSVDALLERSGLKR